MPYDQSWMGYGLVGALEAGLIALVTGVLAALVFARLLRGHSHAAQVAWAWLVAVALSSARDLWNMFYFNFAGLESVSLIRAKLAEVHDMDGLPLRVVFELVGAGAGVAIGWFAQSLRRPRGGMSD